MPFAWQFGFEILKESVSEELLAVTGANAIDWKLSHNITTLRRANDQPGVKGVRNILAVSSGKGGWVNPVLRLTWHCRWRKGRESGYS